MERIKLFLKSHLPMGSFGRWLLSGIRSSPIGFLVVLFKSLFATKKLTGKFFPLRIRVGAGQKFKVNKALTSSIMIEANLSVNQWGGCSLPSSLTCAEGSTLIVSGDFEIGPGVHISIGRNASLILKGRKKSTASGITCNTRIMVENAIEIGADCIIAWDVLITDSDWHDIRGTERVFPVFIGDNVWIAHGVSITKGASIPSGCIVGAKSLVTKAGVFSEKSMIAGVPAVVRKTDVEWFR